LMARHDRLGCARFAPARLPWPAFICAILDAFFARTGLTSALASQTKRVELGCGGEVDFRSSARR
jgi:hypothetical protein